MTYPAVWKNVSRTGQPRQNSFKKGQFLIPDHFLLSGNSLSFFSFFLPFFWQYNPLANSPFSLIRFRNKQYVSLGLRVLVNSTRKTTGLFSPLDKYIRSLQPWKRWLSGHKVVDTQSEIEYITDNFWYFHPLCLSTYFRTFFLLHQH